MRNPIQMSYWMNWNQENGAYLPLSQVPTQVDIVAVAFNSNSSSIPGYVNFHLGIPNISDATFLADMATLKARGQYVILSIGGGGARLVVDTPQAQAAFTSSVYAVIQKWGFDGIDIDLENESVSASPKMGERRVFLNPYACVLKRISRTGTLHFSLRHCLTLKHNCVPLNLF